MDRDVDAFVKQGGTYETLRRQLEGSGLLLENMIGFASWFADDPSKRKEGLNQMRHDMEMVAGLGGKFIALLLKELLNWIVHGCQSIPNAIGRYWI